VSQNPNSSITKYFYVLSTTKKVLLSLFAFIVLIVVLEFIALIFDANPNWFVKVDKNNTSQVVFNKTALTSRFYTLQTEPYFVTENFNYQKNKNVKRAFIIGDASIAGWPYSKNQSVTTKIESIFSKLSLLNKVELIPISFAGLNSSHAVELVQEITKYKPDLVILFLGHNEFFTHEELTLQVNNINSGLIDIFNQFAFYTGLKKKHSYESDIDDLESILPTLSSESTIIRNGPHFNSIIEKFRENLTQITEICKKEGINLWLPVLTDNLLTPPIGIVQHTSEFQADIIFSNARMAIYRDGDIEKAKELFVKSKELDVIKLRIPEDIKNVYKQLTLIKSSLVRIDSLFEMECENGIPSRKLFLDYIHPNNTGLNIIASTLAKKIIKNLDVNNESLTIDSIRSFANKNLVVMPKDSILAEMRLANLKEQITYE